MVLSKFNPFSSSGSDDEDPTDNVNITGGSKGDSNSDDDIDYDDAPVTMDDIEDEDGEEGDGESESRLSEDNEYYGVEKDVPEEGESHRDLIAPTGLTPEVDMAKVGEDYTRTYFINGWPDDPTNGFLDEIFLQNAVQCDVSIHIRPYDSEKAIKQLEKDAYKARTYLEESNTGMLSGQSKQEDFEETLAIYDALRTTNTELFDVGMYLTIRGETEQEVLQASDDIVRSLRSSPALTKPEIAKYNQKKAIQSVAPVMDDKIEYRTEMMGGAIAAMFPFSTKTLYEPQGVDFGRHAGNGSPVIVNRYEARDTGYNQLTIGDIGSGKSFSTKLNLLRTYASRDDVDIFIIDPLRGFESVNAILGGTPITVGGSLGINPLDIQRTPQEVVERQPDIDPYTTQLKKVMDFFEMFFAQQGLKLGDSRSVLQEAVERAYEDNDITQEIETHSNESPTVQDVVQIIENMVESPREFTGLDSKVHARHIEEYASRLAMSLQQFKEGGQYDNLGGESEIDFGDNDVFYLDLSQQEGSGTFGIIMHILLGEVYEYAKSTDNKVMLAIDEAHYLMSDAQSLSYLTHVVRHSRHHNLSINFITQTIEEFFEHEESEKIAQNTSLKLFQKIESGIPREIADILDLSPQERQHIANAKPGNAERGYSEALIGVEDKGYYPLQVMPSDLEIQLLNYEPKNEPSRNILDVANSVEGVDIPDRPDIQYVKEQVQNQDEEEEFGASDIEEDEEEEEKTDEERKQELMDKYDIDMDEVEDSEESETTENEEPGEDTVDTDMITESTENDSSSEDTDESGEEFETDIQGPNGKESDDDAEDATEENADRDEPADEPIEEEADEDLDTLTDLDEDDIEQVIDEESDEEGDDEE